MKHFVVFLKHYLSVAILITKYFFYSEILFTLKLNTFLSGTPFCFYILFFILCIT